MGDEVATCEICAITLKSGIRYKCYSCPNYIICPNCIDRVEEYGLHDSSHVFLRVNMRPGVSPVVRSIANNNEHYVEGKSGIVPPLLSDRSSWKHKEVCNECNKEIVGYRFFCPSCSVSYCERCEFNGVHDSSHSLLKMGPPPVIDKALVTKNTIDSSHEKCSSGVLLTPLPPPTLEDFGVSTTQLKNMLKRENDLRLGSEVQERYRQGGYDTYVKITEEVQRQVAREFNVDTSIGVELLQCAESLVTDPKDLEDIKNISFYRKYNRMRDGDLKIGDIAPRVEKPLLSLDGSDFRFFEDFLSGPTPANSNGYCVDYKFPCVVIAASHS